MADRIIDWRDLPLVMANSAKGIRRAGARTLNNVAFQSLPRLVSKAEGDMKFSGNARRALGWHIGKASSSTLQAEVKTNRGWFAYHSREGRRRPTGGAFDWRGQRWLFIPREKGGGFVTKRGAIRKDKVKYLFLAPRGDHALVLYRERRGEKKAVLIGIAVKEAKYHVDTDWQAVIEAEWRKSATTILRRELTKQLSYS